MAILPLVNNTFPKNDTAASAQLATANPVMLKSASFGTISEGTLRTADLLEKFGQELEWQIRRNGEFFSRPENFVMRDRLNEIVGMWQDATGDNGELIDEEDAEYLLNETLDGALNYFAPAYGYFGSHPGDGADFGYWVNIDDVKEQVEFVSSKDEEYPASDYRGEWLHVNDHGNATLYVRVAAGMDKEIWSIV